MGCYKHIFTELCSMHYDSGVDVTDFEAVLKFATDNNMPEVLTYLKVIGKDEWADKLRYVIVEEA